MFVVWDGWFETKIGVGGLLLTLWVCIYFGLFLFCLGLSVAGVVDFSFLGLLGGLADCITYKGWVLGLIC